MATQPNTDITRQKIRNEKPNTPQPQEQLAVGMARLLATTYALYLETQGYHWNVEGPHFDTLHEKFGMQYQNMAEAIDDIAERIRIMGHRPPATFKTFETLAEIDLVNTVPNAREMMSNLIAHHVTVIDQLKAMIHQSSISRDIGTEDLLTERLRWHENEVWQMRSFLGEATWASVSSMSMN